MNIALIGASGFIGSALRNEALARGHTVTALVTNPARLPAQPGLTVVQADGLNNSLKQNPEAMLRGLIFHFKYRVKKW